MEGGTYNIVQTFKTFTIMATLTFDQVVNIIKNRSTVPCFILGSNTGEYNPNNLAIPASHFPHFDQDDFNLAPWLSSVTANEINDIQQYMGSNDAEYPFIYIIPLTKLKEVIGTFETSWQQLTQEGYLGDDDYFDYIPDMLEEFLQLIWAFAEFDDNNLFKEYWNTYNNSLFNKFLKATDPHPEYYAEDVSLHERFQNVLLAVNNDQVEFSSQYIA